MKSLRARMKWVKLSMTILVGLLGVGVVALRSMTQQIQHDKCQELASCSAVPGAASREFLERCQVLTNYCAERGFTLNENVYLVLVIAIIAITVFASRSILQLNENGGA